MNQESISIESEMPSQSASRVGLWAAAFTAIITVITFGFAITAVPISGANCAEGCIAYPYLNTVSQFPKDYRWMLPAVILMFSYLALMACIHVYASQEKKVFSQIGLSFAIISTLILAADYFIQFSVIPISLMYGETEGITLLTQYNPHGIFIALEEIGYLVMSLSFIFMAPVFFRKNRLEASVRRVFSVSAILAFVSLTAFSFIFGLDRQDRFEVLIISINWLVLIINGILLSVLFKRYLKVEKV